MSNEPTLQDQTSRLSKSKLMLVFFGLQIALFLSFIDSTSVSTAAPIIGQDLSASSSISWLGTAFLVANTAFQIITSRLSDCFGRKIVLIGALGLFAFGDLLCGFANNKVWLYCARAVAGIGGGGINSLSMIIVSDVVSLEDRGKYQGLLGIAIALGSAAGPFLGGVITQKIYWGWVFWITAPFSVGTMLLIWFLVPLAPVTGKFWGKMKAMDWAGSFLSLAMTVLLLVPASGGGSTFAWNSSIVIGLFIAGGIALLLFVYVEHSCAKFPLIPGRLFKNKNVCLLLIQTWLVGMVYYGNIFYIPLYLQNVLGSSPILSAALLLPLVLTQVFTTTISGFVVKWTDRTASSFYFGFVLWFAGQAAQLCFDIHTSYATIVGVLFAQGCGIGATLQSTLVLAQASGPSPDRAVVTGARNFARTSGGAIALAICNAVLNNVFFSNLPPSVSPDLQNQLRESPTLPANSPESLRIVVNEAYMKGIRVVFVLFVPIIGICLIICFFLKDLRLSQVSQSTPIPTMPSEKGSDIEQQYPSISSKQSAASQAEDSTNSQPTEK